MKKQLLTSVIMALFALTAYSAQLTVAWTNGDNCHQRNRHSRLLGRGDGTLHEPDRCAHHADERDDHQLDRRSTLLVGCKTY